MDESPLAGIGDRSIGWCRAFGDRGCDVSALSVGLCMGTVVIGEPEKSQRGRKGAVWSLFRL